MRLSRFVVRAVAAVAFGAVAFATQAAIVITGTRVVYPAQSREVNVRMRNVDERPVLVQAWIDDGNPAAAPNEIQVPFTLLPAVFRVEPHKGQSLRIMFTGENLPEDRESVYWLNVLEIPPKPADAEQRNMIQLAFRTRIKVFFRPKTLVDDPSSVRAQLKWSIASDEKNTRVVRVENPSPYYVSIGSLTLNDGVRTADLSPGMVPPFGKVDLSPEKGNLEIKTPATANYSVVNDFGTEIKDSAQISGVSK